MIDDVLDTAVDERWLRPLDRALAKFFAVLDPGADDPTLLVGALTSRQLGNSHVCLDLSAVSKELARKVPTLSLDLPDSVEAWRTKLAGSPLVAVVGQRDQPVNTPLVVDGARLYLRRLWLDERIVARGIADRVRIRPVVPTGLKEELRGMFPRSEFLIDWQMIASAITACTAFSVIAGGPGTGKTTTVVRILGLLQTLRMRAGEDPLRIRLAAPTGKAATRLQTSINDRLAELAVSQEVRSSIPSEVTTVHRLLGAMPGTRHFRHHRDNPLSVDILVIDEASMIGIELMSSVFQALPSAARVVLLGDKDQLSSVEAGAVLGELCEGADAGGYSSETVSRIRDVAGQDVSGYTAPPITPLHQHVAMLRDSRRFGDKSGIGTLARAVNLGAVKTARDTLSHGGHRDLSWIQPSGSGVREAVDLAVGVPGGPGLRGALACLRANRPPPEAGDAAYEAWAKITLAEYARFQLLCALREGDTGVAGLNRRIAQALRDAHLVDVEREWYEGRPVLVTGNDYTLGLMNGDVGVTLSLPVARDTHALRVAFRVADRVRFVVPSRLSTVETVYAMTVHKSQGSEFEHAALVLPTKPVAVLTRELLYTGITRAQTRFTLIGHDDCLAAAISERTHRASGLGEAVREMLADLGDLNS